MGNDNKKSESFTKLMNLLEYLTYKTSKKIPFPNKGKDFNLYMNMSKEALIEEIKKSLKNCEDELNKILNSPKYSPGSIFKSEEIDKFTNQTNDWKKYCPNYMHNLFYKTKKLFDKIQDKDYNMIEEDKMDMEGNEGPAIINNNESIQQQKLINKQKVIQAQELALLNDNFGRALASLECFANRVAGKILSNVFNYYDMFSLGGSQDLVELQKKAFVQTQIFKLAYEDYIRKYGAYDVPVNIDTSTIQKYLVIWIYHVPNEYKTMYQGMSNIINSLKNTAFDKKFRYYSQQAKNAKMDPTKIASFAPGVYYYNRQRCDEAKNQYLEEGRIISKLNINQTYKDDKKAEYLYNQIQNNYKNHEDRKFYEDLK